MSWERADWSPVANQIERFGTGLANLALQKHAMQRQLGRDLVDFEARNADMDLTRAKTRREEMDMAGRERLNELFDPTVLTPEQRTGIGVNSLAGKNIFADALRGAKLGQEAAQAKELFDNGSPVERLSIVTGSAVKPYALNGKTGAVINQMTGEVSADTPLSTKILTGGGTAAGSIDPDLNTAVINQLYTRTIRTTDPFGVERISNLPDADALQRDIKIAALMGLPWNTETAFRLRTGQITVPPAVAQIVDAAATPAVSPTPAPAATDGKDWTEGLGVDDGLRQQVNALASQYRAGEITQDQLAQALKELGIQ